MHNGAWKRIYDTLYDTADEKVAGVENAFAAGSFCEVRYCQMLAAYERLHNKLWVLGEDTDDLELILSVQRDIEMELCRRMYYYGTMKK